MQEVSLSTVENLKTRMNYKHSQYQGTSNPANGLAVFSKFPLKNGRSIKNDDGQLIASSCDIVLPNGTIRLINLHLHTNAVTLRVNRFSPESISQKEGRRDRKSTRLNSSHVAISYAVFCLKKKKEVK